MVLFHGSNVKVEKPQIIISNRALDFGAGFYTTSSREQAKKWAKIQAYRRRKGKPIVTAYQFDEEILNELSILHFDSADISWLDYVTMNRKGIYSGPKYDIVIGPVANDNTIPVISDYMAGVINKETALVLLKPQKLVDQYAFLTWRGLSALVYQEVKQYE
ncbi:MAG: DUF3990 domain-containing protein [Lachnospiraceae bacterium]|nr:DUF3990 domain-containing protein [Lachnospiraceae bacterium]